MRARLLVAALGLVLALPASAGAHSLIRIQGTVLYYISVDEVSTNTVTISRTPTAIKVSDPTVVGGLDPGPCTPVTPTEVNCPSLGLTALHLEVGDNDDVVDVQVSLPATVELGLGNDTFKGTGEALGGSGPDTVQGDRGSDVLNGGGGDDTLAGGLGDDRIAGEAGNDGLRGDSGADVLDGGAGNDTIAARDGIVDSIACGAGTDGVTADLDDTISLTETIACENTQRAAGGGDVGEEDTTPPKFTLTAPRSQRVGRSREVKVYAEVDETAVVDVSGSIAVSGRDYKLKSQRRQSEKAGAGRLTMLLDVPRRAADAMRRAARKGRKRFTATVQGRARDGQGNRSQPRQREIRVRY